MKSHIRLTTLPSPKVLVCGSPERAALIAKGLKDSRLLAQNREYHTYTGLYQNKPVVVASHGVGSAGAAICFNELIDCGAQVLIRLGTAGGLYEESQIGDVVVPTAAIRNDGVSLAMVPPEYPAVADLALTADLIAGMKAAKLAGRTGTILTSDLFYPSLLGDKLAFYQKARAVAVEMECSTLFILAQLRGARAAAILVLDGNPLKWHEGHYDPDSKKIAASVEQATAVCFNALTRD